MDNLSNVFDVESRKLPVILTPTPEHSTTSAAPAIDTTEQDLITDLQASRKDYDDIIEMGKIALTDVLAIAQQGQHPRFFEAAGAMIKSLSEANRERMEIHLKLSQIRRNQAETKGGSKVNIDKAAMFVGTTEELQQLLNPRKDRKIDTI